MRNFATGNIVSYSGTVYIVSNNDHEVPALIPFDYSNCSSHPWGKKRVDDYRKEMAENYKGYKEKIDKQREHDDDWTRPGLWVFIDDDKIAEKIFSEEPTEWVESEGSTFGGYHEDSEFWIGGYYQCKPENVEKTCKKYGIEGVELLASTMKEYIIQNLVGKLWSIS